MEAPQGRSRIMVWWRKVVILLGISAIALICIAFYGLKGDRKKSYFVDYFQTKIHPKEPRNIQIGTFHKDETAFYLFLDECFETSSIKGNIFFEESGNWADVWVWSIDFEKAQSCISNPPSRSSWQTLSPYE